MNGIRSSISRVAINFLGAIAFLSLMGCTDNFTASKIPVSANSAAPEIAVYSTPIGAEKPEMQILENPVSQLSPEQVRQLSQLEVPVLMPTYLPPTFQITQVDAGREELVDDSYDYYSILYQGENNTCLAISSGVDPALSTERLTKTTVTTALGEAEIYTGIVEDRALIMADLPTQQRHLLRSGLVAKPTEMNPNGSWASSEWCEPVSQEEFLQVLQSLEAVQFDR
ncbi:MAG TPA: hypothetical protein V6D29_08695 [Leptolyngbyaceae cyanobacterium]